jgi:hypothetical protein
VCYDEDVSVRDHEVQDADSDPTFDRARLPMVLAAVGVAGGLAIAGSIERTAGGAIILGAWVVGIVALHRLGRAGSHRAARPDRPQASCLGPRAKDDQNV